MSIKVVLLNTPMVHIDNEPVAFPFRKAEALFYYLAVEKHATRDELVNILWGDMDEENAKKNLRHAMYKLRKTFDMDIVISPQRSVVMLNNNILMDIDIDNFLENNLEVYKGEFLQGFNVKDSVEFDEWMMQKRAYFKNIYINRLHQRIELALKNNDEFIKTEQYCRLLITEDPFDERAYRTLMKMYAREGSFSKVANIYSLLTEVLQKELGISTDGDTKSLYSELMLEQSLEVSAQDKGTKEFFYDRRQELSKMKLFYDKFMENKLSKSIVILGEAGIGKTKLKDYFLRNIKEKNVCILESSCYQAEEEYYLKPWNSVFERLAEIIYKDEIDIPLLWKNVISYMFPIFETGSNIANINPVEKIESLKYQVSEEAIIGVLKKISAKKKIILVFDDIQWMDQMSLRLLKSILLRQQKSDIFFISTCRSGYEERVDKFITDGVKYAFLEKIEIERFTQRQVEDFAKHALPKYIWSEDIIKRIYNETEGNTFFLVEIINAIKENCDIGEMSAKMQDIIKSRFLGLSDTCKKVLNIASLFFDRFSLDIIKKISQNDEFELIDIMEELQKRYILKEFTDGMNIYYEFTHQKLRDYIYMNQSLARRKILHNRIGQVLETTLKHNAGDRFIYPKLIYHFKNGGNPCATLEYLIKNLEDSFNLNHEMFPVLSDSSMDEKKYIHINNDDVIRQFNEIEVLFNKLNEDEKHLAQSKTLDMAFLHMKGRYLIYEGKYEEGTSCIEKMITSAIKKENGIFAAKGYRQMIYYCIQTHNIRSMKENLDKGIDLARRNNLQKETGILLRLKGLYETMCGEYERAEETLKQSIGIFKAINQYEDRYSLNIAAGYNYIGEIRRYNMKFGSALEYYDKAMEICEENKILRGLSIFNSHAGQAALDMGDYVRAVAYLQKAIKYYNQLDTLWGRSTAEGYLALLLVKEGDYKGALVHLINAEKYAEKLQSPYEMGLVYRVKAEIKASMKKNSSLRQALDSYLPLDLGEYCYKGIRLLEEVKESYEVDILKSIQKNNG